MKKYGVLIIVMKSICDSLVMSRQELGQPIFLDGIFGLTHMMPRKRLMRWAIKHEVNITDDPEYPFR
jgi:hypothetical protein